MWIRLAEVPEKQIAPVFMLSNAFWAIGGFLAASHSFFPTHGEQMSRWMNLQHKDFSRIKLSTRTDDFIDHLFLFFYINPDRTIDWKTESILTWPGCLRCLSNKIIFYLTELQKPKSSSHPERQRAEHRPRIHESALHWLRGETCGETRQWQFIYTTSRHHPSVICDSTRGSSSYIVSQIYTNTTDTIMWNQSEVTWNDSESCEMIQSHVKWFGVMWNDFESCQVHQNRVKWMSALKLIRIMYNHV